MKISFLFVTGLLLFNQAFSQKKADSKDQQAVAVSATTAQSSGSSPDYITIQEKVYRTSLKYGDLNGAKNALLNLIVIKPENKTLRDTLAMLYYNLNSLAECLLVTRENLETSPDNVAMLELKAVSEQGLGLTKESLSSYEKLYSKSKELYHLYQIATLQYELKRYGECKLSAEQILADKESEKKELNIGAGRGQQQKVTFKAATLNLKGVMALDVNDYVSAKSSFEEALKLNPDFVLAKGNLEALDSKLKKPTPALPSKGKTGK